MSPPDLIRCTVQLPGLETWPSARFREDQGPPRVGDFRLGHVEAVRRDTLLVPF